MTTAAVGLMAWRAFPSDTGGLPDEVLLSCKDGVARVRTPEVALQERGLVIEVEDLRPGGVISVFPEPQNAKRSLYPSPLYPDVRRSQILAPTGTMRILCGYHRTPGGGAQSVEVSDPGGFEPETWRLDCSPDPLDSDAGYPYVDAVPFFVKGNPLPEALYRAIPGMRPTDRIEDLSFLPRDPLQVDGYIIRDGEAVANVYIAKYGSKWFFGLSPCPSSEIGLRPSQIQDPPEAGLLATPYELPSERRCDPYTHTCAVLFVTAAWYEGRTGEDVRLYAREPSAACAPSQPYGCPPSPKRAIIQLLVSPAQLQTFVDREQCGTTETFPCR
ncbi:MAG: hypothetical protein WEA10_02070 [Actinomycetota bacterium]